MPVGKFAILPILEDIGMVEVVDETHEKADSAAVEKDGIEAVAKTSSGDHCPNSRLEHEDVCC